MGLTQRKTNHSIGLHPWKKFVLYNNDTLHRHKSETTYMSMDILPTIRRLIFELNR